MKLPAALGVVALGIGMVDGLSAQGIAAFSLSGSELDTVTVNGETVAAEELINGRLTAFYDKRPQVILPVGDDLPTPLTNVLSDRVLNSGFSDVGDFTFTFDVAIRNGDGIDLLLWDWSAFGGGGGDTFDVTIEGTTLKDVGIARHDAPAFAGENGSYLNGRDLDSPILPLKAERYIGDGPASSPNVLNEKVFVYRDDTGGHQGVIGLDLSDFGVAEDGSISSIEVSRSNGYDPTLILGVYAAPGASESQTAGSSGEVSPEPVRFIDGYRGIWFDLKQNSKYGSKYSGGLGTYTAKHQPLAVYAPEADKTFFVFGGTTEEEKRHLLAMVSYYDHRTGQVPKPVVVHDKKGVDDPHDNPSLQMDDEGRLWVFVSGRGGGRSGEVYRSRLPYDITSFEHVAENEFTYPQPWWVDEDGFLFLFTKYRHGRELYWRMGYPDEQGWVNEHQLAGMGGHYQISNERDGRVITAFNMHPGGVVDKRTNMYFVQTDDRGETWRTAGGEPLETPLTDPASPALVHDYESEGRLVYLKDIGFDSGGNPVILYVTSGHHQPGPQGDPRTWTVAHWTGDSWSLNEVTTSTHNYDMGSLYIEDDGIWRIIAPTEAGPQHHGTGGEIAMWVSRDEGESWEKVADVTRNSPRNHGYVRRPVNAHPDFYGFWADGNPDEMSPSRLYFTGKYGEDVWTLPYDMKDDLGTPIRLTREE